MKHWVFDLDGTLVDSFGHYFDVVKEIFESQGIPFEERFQHEALTRPLNELFAFYFGPARARPLLERLQASCIAHAPEIRPFEGIMDTLATLSAGGSRLAVWTNRDRESAGIILDAAGLTPLLRTWVSGTCVIERKPSPEGLLRIASELGCEPREITVVGDHEMDVIGAKAAGARAVRALWHSYWPAEQCSQSDFQFDDVERFHEWVRSNR